jgi:hypothetical protein
VSFARCVPYPPSMCPETCTRRRISSPIADGHTFSATSRPSRVSSARYTSPLPPAPTGAAISQDPRRVAEVSGIVFVSNRRHVRFSRVPEAAGPVKRRAAGNYPRNTMYSQFMGYSPLSVSIGSTEAARRAGI